MEAIENPVCVSGMAAFDWELPRELELYAGLDVDLVGLPAAKLESFGRERAVAEIAQSGVRAAYLVRPLWSEPADAAGCAADLAALDRAVEMTAELGADLVYLTSGRSGALPWGEAARALVERLAPVAERARRAGVRLAIENTSPVRCDLSFTHTARDAFAVADMIGAGICLDLYCCWQERDLAEAVASSVDRIHLVQVSDLVVGTQTFPNRWVPGDGDLPLDRLLGEVLAAGYRGPVDIELTGPEVARQGADVALARSIAWLRDRLGSAAGARKGEQA